MKEGGYSFEPKGLSIAPKTLANFLERKTQLYTPFGAWVLMKRNHMSKVQMLDALGNTSGAG